MLAKRRWTDEDLINAFNHSENLAQIIKTLNLALTGGNYKWIQKHLVRLNLSFQANTNIRKLMGIKKHQYKKTYKDDEIFVENSFISQTGMRARYLKIRNTLCCDNCGISEWNSKPLTFQVDHKNGIRNDNRLENLNLLCPNCHSQTETFSGKNIKKKINFP